MLIQWSSKIYLPCILFITYLEYGHQCELLTRFINGFLNPYGIESPQDIRFNPTPKPVIRNHLPNVLQPANSIHLKKHITPASRSYGTTPNHGPKQNQPPHNTPATKTTKPITPNHGPNQNQPTHNIHVTKTPKPITPNHGPNQNQPTHNIHVTKPTTPTTRKSVSNQQPLLQPTTKQIPTANKAAKNSTENLHLTNEKETIESALLLSSEDSIDNLPIINLINSSSPANAQHSNNKAQENSKNSYYLIKSVEKNVISNKVSTVHHYNVETKINYVKNPYIIVGIVALAAIILAIVIIGIVVNCRKKN